MVEELDEDYIDLHVGSAVKKSCFMRWVALVWLPLLILAGVIASFFGLIAFKVQIHSVIMISVIFIIFLFFVKHNAHFASCKFIARHGEMSTALKWYIKNNQLTIGDKTKTNAPFDTFMQEFSQKLRNDNFASVAAGVFPTLGILGTFISIALSMPDFSTQSSAQLEREISLLLGGVGTAFYVSIYGIFLSLWWTFYEKRGMSRFEENIASIKENLRHYFWSKEEIEQVHFAKSMDNYAQLNRTFEKVISHDFIASMENTLQHRLELFDSVISHEQNALQKASGHFDRIIQEGGRSMAQSERLLDSYEKLSLSMQQIASRLDDNNHMMWQMSERMANKEQLLSDAEERLGKHIASLNDSMGNLSADNVKELYSAVVQNVEIMKSESAKAGYTFHKNLDDFDEKYTKKLRSSLELIDSETAKIVQQIASLRLIDNR